MTNQGYIQVYTGNGKGKTTAAIGLAVRAAGRNKRTYIAQFLKKGEYGEIRAISTCLKKFITLQQFGLPGFHHQSKGVSQEERQAAYAGLEAVRKALAQNTYDVVIMDEVNLLLHFKIVALQDVLDIIDGKPAATELILTGRCAPQLIIQRADLVTEMKEIKHYYQQGVQAREGFEK
jgi:cob(I)alamin adenosyltransferase